MVSLINCIEPNEILESKIYQWPLNNFLNRLTTQKDHSRLDCVFSYKYDWCNGSLSIEKLDDNFNFLIDHQFTSQMHLQYKIKFTYYIVDIEKKEIIFKYFENLSFDTRSNHNYWSKKNFMLEYDPEADYSLILKLEKTKVPDNKLIDLIV